MMMTIKKDGIEKEVFIVVKTTVNALTIKVSHENKQVEFSFKRGYDFQSALTEIKTVLENHIFN